MARLVQIDVLLMLCVILLLVFLVVEVRRIRIATGKIAAKPKTE